MSSSNSLVSEQPYSSSREPADIEALIDGAKSLYKEIFDGSKSNENAKTDDAAATASDGLICAIAPGRVNLIGEHTDYTGGFVFPMAIGFSTTCIGTGALVDGPEGECQISSVNKSSEDGEGSGSKENSIITFTSSKTMTPLPTDHPDAWANYVAGVVKEYMAEIPDDTSISIKIAINGNVPLGSGLSSSAALEVAVATFLERIINDKFPKLNLGGPKEKALRCQRAENVFCNSPCGIMDQYVSSTASTGSAIMIDCRSLNYESVKMGSGSSSSSTSKDGSDPVFIICNSNVKHSIGGGEYPVRVQQCKEATKTLRNICGDTIESLRDATIADVEMARKKRKSGGGDDDHGDDDVDAEPLMDDLIYRRAKHVVTENERTRQAKEALVAGDWAQFGALMNESHESMKTDYEVSCEEIDFLADLAQKFDGVYGSRLTGGGFGGCTVTLVERSRAKALCEHLKTEYRKKWNGNECSCFETSPGPGARSYKF